MRLGLVLSFILSLLLLKRFVYKRISFLTILQLTCVLIVLIIAVDNGSKQNSVEFYIDAQEEEAHQEKLKFLGDLLKQEDLGNKESSGEKGDSGNKESFVAPVSDCNCPDTIQEVCGEDNVTYRNSCLAQCNNVKVHKFSACQAEAITAIGGVPAQSGIEVIDDLRIGNHAPLSFYFTVYDMKSYPSAGSRAWFDLAKRKQDLELMFSRVPSITNLEVENGLYLGDNSVVGPFTSDLGINSGAFTIFMMVRIQDLVADSTPIDILKLYGNTQDNNALTLRLSEVSRANVIQTAKMSIKVGGSPNWFYAKINNNTNIPFDSQVTFFFAIVCQHSNVELFVSSSLDHHMRTIMKYELNNTISLSNKAMELNPSKNFNAFIKTFGGYDAVLQPGELDKVSAHMFMEEKKLDKQYMQEKERAAVMESKMRSMKQCPYDTATCNKCDDVKDWSTPRALIDADTKCLSEINRFCTNNPYHELCSCWNKSDKNYDSKKCQNLMRYLTNAEYYDLKDLDSSSLETVKKLYKLQDVPPPTTAPPMTSTPPPTTTRKPVTPMPTRPPLKSMDSMMLAAARGNDIGEDEMMKMMMEKLMKKKNKEEDSEPVVMDTIVPARRPKPAVPPPLFEDEPPRGVWGWVKSMFTSDIPDSVPDWPTPEA
jgi:hypothetical protein